MKITDLKMAEFLHWLHIHTPIGYLIEKYFDIEYFSGEDGVFMEICKETNE